MTDAGIICVTIDDIEVPRLWMLLGEEFDFANHLGTAAIRINPGGRKAKRKLALQHEYALFFAKASSTEVGKILIAPEDKSHTYIQDTDGSWYELRNLRKEGQDSLAKPDSVRFYPIYVEPSTGQISTSERLSLEILPIDTSGQKRIWRRDKDDIELLFHQGDLMFKYSKAGPQLYFKFRGGIDGETPKSIWDDAKFSASEYGTPALEDRVGPEKFDFPKSPFAVMFSIQVMSSANNVLVLDYFAGSGTTGHAVINLNHDDGGTRKYILIEMGEYFNTVLKPRITKVIYSKGWKDGMPENHDTGISQIVKVLRLESYEDSLSNLQYVARNQPQTQFIEANDAVREDYMLRYVMNAETTGSSSLLNVQAFAHPFEYKLKVAADTVGETKEVSVDLVETFNWLLGLRVHTMDVIRGFHVITGRLPGPGNSDNGEKALIIWRDTTENPNDKLDEFFGKQAYNTLDQEFDVIYVNGDNNLQNLRKDDQTWKVRLIEEEFHRLMWDVEDI